MGSQNGSLTKVPEILSHVRSRLLGTIVVNRACDIPISIVERLGVYHCFLQSNHNKPRGRARRLRMKTIGAGWILYRCEQCCDTTKICLYPSKGKGATLPHLQYFTSYRERSTSIKGCVANRRLWFASCDYVDKNRDLMHCKWSVLDWCQGILESDRLNSWDLDNLDPYNLFVLPRLVKVCFGLNMASSVQPPWKFQNKPGAKTLRAKAGNACAPSSYCQLLRIFLSSTDDVTVLSAPMVSDFLQDSQRTLGCFKNLFFPLKTGLSRNCSSRNGPWNLKFQTFWFTIFVGDIFYVRLVSLTALNSWQQPCRPDISKNIACKTASQIAAPGYWYEWKRRRWLVVRFVAMRGATWKTVPCI